MLKEMLLVLGLVAWLPCQQSLAPARSVRRTAAVFHARAAYVFNEHFSALRRAPRADAPIIERLGRGRLTAILGHRRSTAGALYYRVATTRRTRGWIDSGAIVSPAIPGDAQRLLAAIQSSEDFARFELGRIMLLHFKPSSARAEALMVLGGEAERAAQTLTESSHRKKIGRRWGAGGRPAEEVYLNFESLDRYNRLGVRFRFDPINARYLYDGYAYRELTRTQPSHPLAAAAAGRLKLLEDSFRANSQPSP